jgi:hypothetical protein
LACIVLSKEFCIQVVLCVPVTATHHDHMYHIPPPPPPLSHTTPTPPPNQVMKNSAAFAAKLQSLGYVLVSGGTDNHLVLVDLKKSKVACLTCEVKTVWGRKNISISDSI